MGPSGSGKSTLMNLIGCLDTPTKGDYYIAGRLVSQMNDDELARIRNKEIGFVLDITCCRAPRSQRRTAHDLRGMKADAAGTRRRRCAWWTWKTGCTSDELRRQRQRVAVARALVNNPSILLADEPTGNLDSATGNEIMGLFDRLFQQGNTIVLVTHEHDIAMYAHRVIHVRDGKVERDEKIK
jgi:putative ABC transport system ATP-binding protein